MKSYLEHLSVNNDKDGDTLKALFFDSFLDKIDKPGNKLAGQWTRLDFVRLNIVAHKP